MGSSKCPGLLDLMDVQANNDPLLCFSINIYAISTTIALAGSNIIVQVIFYY